MLPVGVLIAFLCMRALGINSNIMSLGGIAIAIGAMVDAAIVMIENAHKHIERLKPGESRAEAMVAACKEVGPALFFSLLIITVSFLPVFTLEAQEGRLFSPLAYTKTFAMAGAAILSVTLVPVLMALFIRGRILPEASNPVNRVLIALYRPVIAGVMRWKKATLLVAAVVLGITVIPASRLGTEFMPRLNEGTIFYMPTSLPAMSVTKAGELLQIQDRILKSFPEVASVAGKAGRAQTATDPAPLEMFETIINLKPESAWRAGMTIDKLIAEMDKAMQFPGVSNAWTMPIQARIDMLSTGIRTPVGIKVFGKDLGEMERVARDIEAVVKEVPGATSAYAERITGGYYLDIEPDRAALARYGLAVGDLQDVIMTALGGEMVTTTVEGRERFGVIVRYPRDLRSDPQAIASQVLVPAMSEMGQPPAMIPLGQVATVRITKGAPAIRTENALLSAYIYVDLHGRDIGGFVADAQKAVATKVDFPPGYFIQWSGQFEYMERAVEKLKIVVPLTLFAIVVLLYLNFRRMTETLIVMLSVPFALVGGVWLVWWLDYNVSVAVAVGFIALAGVAAETGVVMLIYLEHAWERIRAERGASGAAPTAGDLYGAVMEGAVERVRPKMMTVVAIMAGLLPIMWSTGTGSEVMRRIAAPMVGGMVSVDHPDPGGDSRNLRPGEGPQTQELIMKRLALSILLSTFAAFAVAQHSHHAPAATPVAQSTANEPSDGEVRQDRQGQREDHPEARRDSQHRHGTDDDGLRGEVPGPPRQGGRRRQGEVPRRGDQGRLRRHDDREGEIDGDTRGEAGVSAPAPFGAPLRGSIRRGVAARLRLLAGGDLVDARRALLQRGDGASALPPVLVPAHLHVPARARPADGALPVRRRGSSGSRCRSRSRAGWCRSSRSCSSPDGSPRASGRARRACPARKCRSSGWAS